MFFLCSSSVECGEIHQYALLRLSCHPSRTCDGFGPVYRSRARFKEVLMETMLRLQCDNLLGGRIERETPTGLVTIATVARETDGLVVHVIDGQEGPGLE